MNLKLIAQGLRLIADGIDSDYVTDKVKEEKVVESTAKVEEPTEKAPIKEEPSKGKPAPKKEEPKNPVEKVPVTSKQIADKVKDLAIKGKKNELRAAFEKFNAKNIPQLKEEDYDSFYNEILAIEYIKEEN